MWAEGIGLTIAQTPEGAFSVLTFFFWEAGFPHLQMRIIMPGVAVTD